MRDCAGQIKPRSSRWDSGGWPHEWITWLEAAASKLNDPDSTTNMEPSYTVVWDASCDPTQVSTTPPLITVWMGMVFQYGLP